jgi:hypothetical protein
LFAFRDQAHVDFTFASSVQGLAVRLQAVMWEKHTPLRRSTVLAAGAVTASAFITLCALAATAWILRVLPRAEAGRFALLVELLYALGVLGSLGQPTLQARLYQQSGAGEFDWGRDLRSTVAITFPAILLAALALAIPYSLTSFEIAIISVGSELFVLISCLSAILAQQQRYAWSSALLRLPNGLLIIPTGLMLVHRSWLNLHFVLSCFLLLLFLTVLLSIWLLRRQLERGRTAITFKQRLPGFTFLVAVVAIIATQRGMIAVAGAVLTPEKIAALAALVVLLRVFDLVGEPTGRVFATEMARDSRAITPAMLAAPWLMAGVLSALLLIALPPAVRHFYAGRYDAALPLLPWLIAAGALRFVEIVPRGFAFYLAATRSIYWFGIVQSMVAIAGLALMVKWTKDYNSRGTVWAAALIAAVRVGASYVFFAHIRTRSDGGRENLEVKGLEIAGQEPPV